MRLNRYTCLGGAALLAVVATAAISVPNRLEAATDVATDIPTSLVSIAPCRLIDTRTPGNIGNRSTPLGPREVATVAVWGANGACNIPTNATAIAANATSDNPTADSYLTVYPSGGSSPNASNLNWTAGEAPSANAVTVGLSSAGAIDIFNFAGTVDIIIDISGYYVDAGAPVTPPPPPPPAADAAPAVAYASADTPIAVAGPALPVLTKSLPAGSYLMSGTVGFIPSTQGNLICGLTVGTEPVLDVNGVAVDARQSGMTGISVSFTGVVTLAAATDVSVTCAASAVGTIGLRSLSALTVGTIE